MHLIPQQPAQPNTISPLDLLLDEQVQACFSEDFGKILYSRPAAVVKPHTTGQLQQFVQYAHTHKLPLTIRGFGLSQSGQSLPYKGSILVSMEHFTKIASPAKNAIWVETNATWAQVIEHTIPHGLIPAVLPHNTHLSIGGVISAGGIGASSFRFGSICNQIRALEVVTADGQRHQVYEHDPLFHACLGGQGQFGIITQVQLALIPCQPKIRTFYLLYADETQWLKDFYYCQKNVDYIDAFCTPAPLGAKLTPTGRKPFAQWFYALQISQQYFDKAPELDALGLNPWQFLHTQDESISSYLNRHDSRFKAMKSSGQWEQTHPWYECFLPYSQWQHVANILAEIPLFFAPVIHTVAIDNSNPQKNFLALPNEEQVFGLMILPPGLSNNLLPAAVAVIKNLDAQLLALGGKRYLSGFLGEELPEEYWQQHFGRRYREWMSLKEEYDPHHLFCSLLFPR